MTFGHGHGIRFRRRFVAGGGIPVDVNPPILSAASGTPTGQTTATLGVTTNEGGGDLYAFVSTSATPPSAAVLKAGTGAAFAQSVIIAGAGAKTFNATGLTAGTTYYAHFLHRDAAANESAIASSASFATAAATPLTAPVLTWTSPASDSTPSFDAVLTDEQVADVVRLQLATDSGFTTNLVEYTDTLDSAEVTAGEVTFGSGIANLTSTTWYARSRLERGATVSSWSNTETKTINDTAPALSSATGAVLGSTNVSATFTSDEAGTFYYATLAAASAAPSAANLIAGTVSGAIAQGSAAMVVGSNSTGNLGGHTAGTAYKVHITATDANGNISAVASTGSVTTDAASGTTFDPAAKASSITLSNGNLTATRSGGSNTDKVKATTFRTPSGTGIHYAVKMTIHSGTVTVGFGSSGVSVTAGSLGDSGAGGSSVASFSGSTSVLSSGGGGGSWSAFPSGTGVVYLSMYNDQNPSACILAWSSDGTSWNNSFPTNPSTTDPFTFIIQLSDGGSVTLDFNPTGLGGSRIAFGI